MPQFTRERQREATLLDICLAVHMHNTGSSDPMPPDRLNEAVQILRDATRHWEEGPIQSLEFDTAVRWLVDATLVEHDRYAQEAFDRHLQNAAEIVGKWPTWKQNVLG